MRSRWITAAAVSALFGLGCAQVVGVDFDSARLAEADALDGGAEGRGAVNGDAAPGASGPAACAPDQKKCDGSCVSTSDPAFGCGGSSCAACSLPYATGAKCAAGACVVDTCVEGRADCDGKADNGCESSLSSVDTCRSCATKCPGTEVCAPTGCASTCPGGLTNCGGSCVDPQSDIDHCGSCTKECAPPANGNPVCNAGNCNITCQAGYADCDDNVATGCEPQTRYYLDQDGDTVGGSTSQLACSPPSAQWVTTSGDCLDSNTSVFPGQAAFFTTAYSNAQGNPSFDYDCDGAETAPSAVTAYPGCDNSLCGAAGYLPAPARAGADNPYCGSTSGAYCYNDPFICAYYGVCDCFTNTYTNDAVACK